MAGIQFEQMAGQIAMGQNPMRAVGVQAADLGFVLGTPLINDPFHAKRWDYYNSVQVGENLVSEEKFPLGYFRVYEFDYFRLSKDDAPDGVFD